ncbi:MAG: transporter [Verrucomicrobiota bacterium]
MNPIYKHTLLLTFTLSAASAQLISDCCGSETTSGRPDGHASISIMGDHTHNKGSWMLSFRSMYMEMEGLRSGTDRLTSAEAFTSDGGYTVVPTEMTMQMQMLGLMYAPSDSITLMLMANYLQIEMDHQINPNAAPLIAANGGSDEFTTESSGLGDIQLVALFDLYEKENRKLHAGLGLSLPTGAIDEQDATPLAGMPPTFAVQQLPAAMQLGSGTFDLLPSLTYRAAFEKWSYGAQAKATLRLEDENSQGYRLGHRFELTGWTSCNLNEWVALNSGLSYQNTGKLKGTQEDISQIGPAGRSVTTTFNDNYGGERVDAILGLNFIAQSGCFKGHRLGLDLRLPIWQDLNGVQLETDLVATIGWQKAF